MYKKECPTRGLMTAEDNGKILSAMDAAEEYAADENGDGLPDNMVLDEDEGSLPENMVLEDDGSNRKLTDEDLGEYLQVGERKHVITFYSLPFSLAFLIIC